MSGKSYTDAVHTASVQHAKYGDRICRTYLNNRRVMRCGQDGPYARRTAQAICRYGQAGQRSRRRAAGRSRGPDVLPGMRPRRCASTRSSAALWPAPGSHLRVYAQALLRRPRALAATRVGRGALGASLCREPLQYRHIAAGSPPRPASHIASVAHVPIIEIGSSLLVVVCVLRRSGLA